MMLASVRPAAAGAVRVPYPAAAFPEYWAGRLSQLYFRGLLKAHSRYGLSGFQEKTQSATSFSKYPVHLSLEPSPRYLKDV